MGLSFGILARCLLIICLLVFLSGKYSAAEQVQIEYNGLDLLGNVEIAPGKSLEADGVIIIVHETLSHGETPFIIELQQSLLAEGLNSLSITKSLGLNARQGPFNCDIEQNHRHEDGADEIGAWLTWLGSQNVRKINLLGIERGSNQSALHIYSHILKQKEYQKLKKKKKKRKKLKLPIKPINFEFKLMLLSPLDLTPEKSYELYFQKNNVDLGQILARAQQFIDQGNGFELLEGEAFLNCKSAKVTASAFINYTLPEKEHSIRMLLEELKLPTLIILNRANPLYGVYEDVISQQLILGRGQLSLAVLPSQENIDEISVSDLTRHIVQFVKR